MDGGHSTGEPSTLGLPVGLHDGANAEAAALPLLGRKPWRRTPPRLEAVHKLYIENVPVRLPGVVLGRVANPLHEVLGENAAALVADSLGQQLLDLVRVLGSVDRSVGRQVQG